MDPSLVWTYCEVCGGIYLPFDRADRLLYERWIDGK